MRYTWWQLETWIVWSLKLLKTLWSRPCETAWKGELLSYAGWALQYIMIRLGAFWWVDWFSDGAYVERVLKSPPETDTLHWVRTQFCICKVEQHAEIDSFWNASRALATSHFDDIGEQSRGAPFGPASQAWKNKTRSCWFSGVPILRLLHVAAMQKLMLFEDPIEVPRSWVCCEQVQ